MTTNRIMIKVGNLRDSADIQYCKKYLVPLVTQDFNISLENIDENYTALGMCVTKEGLSLASKGPIIDYVPLQFACRRTQRFPLKFKTSCLNDPTLLKLLYIGEPWTSNKSAVIFGGDEVIDLVDCVNVNADR